MAYFSYLCSRDDRERQHRTGGIYIARSISTASCENGYKSKYTLFHHIIMKQYQLLNNICGWVVFVIAAVTYILTLEPTASFWDCGEFISSAYKLEVGHPPGNPIFMLTGRFFANFASDPSQVAYMINLMSGLFSAATILLLFWTITHLTRRIIVRDDSEMTLAQMIVILGCGAVGALAYTWSDTFWFSAVEGEVYAYSSFCTALVFWLILKWEDVADRPHSDRYIILIAYVIGISIAVHLLNLLTIPALVLVYYFRKFPNPTTKGALIALLLSFAGIVFLLYGLVPGFVKVAGWAELLCVNVFGMPFNSGVIVYFFLVIGCISWGIYETYKQNSLNRLRLSFLISVILVGLPFISSKIYIGILISAGTGHISFLQETVARAAAQHGAGIGAGHLHRLLFLCTHRHTLVGQHTDGSELARRCLCPGQLPQP